MKLEYLRPDSVEEAVGLLQDGVPLGGGTELTPRRRELRAVIDLSRLGLDRITLGDPIELGAAATLQAMVEADLPAALIQACRLEAGWNMRNMASLAGTLVSADGRSPLATALLAMGCELSLEPGAGSMTLDDYLDARPSDRLITGLRLALPGGLHYEQVARTPADRPQVCVAAALTAGALRVALGGYGDRPLLIAAELAAEAGSADAAAEAAQTAYANADDPWASGEYRAAAATVLARRVVLGALG